MAFEPLGDHIEEDDGLEETVVDVGLDESLDSVEVDHDQPAEVDDELGEFDPEAGRSRIGGRTTLTGHLTSEAGMFVIGSVTAIVGTSVLIYALVIRSPQTLIAAGVISPPTLIWAFVKWRRWLGGAPYIYRMLMSLDEKEAASEVMSKHRERQRQQVEKRIAELEARGVKIKGKKRSSRS